MLFTSCLFTQFELMIDSFDHTIEVFLKLFFQGVLNEECLWKTKGLAGFAWVFSCLGFLNKLTFLLFLDMIKTQNLIASVLKLLLRLQSPLLILYFESCLFFLFENVLFKSLILSFYGCCLGRNLVSWGRSSFLDLFYFNVIWRLTFNYTL